MDHEIIEEAVERIRGLPTFSRIRDELRNKFALNVDERKLQEKLDEMMMSGKLRETQTTIKGNRFKGYTTVEKETVAKQEEEKTPEEKIIDEVFS